MRLIESVVYAGWWDIGGVNFQVRKRPSWFQRVMVRWCFGWEWREISEGPR